MNARQQDIIDILERTGEMTIKELAERLNVTAMTIHRDLQMAPFGGRVCGAKRPRCGS